MKNINLLITLILLSTAVQAQNFSGKIADEKAQPVAFANVVLFALPDSTFVCGTTSDDNGNFEITDNSLGGKYFARVSCIGYKSTDVNCDKANLGTIILKSDAIGLGEVVVVEKTPRTTFRGNAIVTRIEGTVLEKAGDAYDVLDRLPLVDAKREKEQVKVLQKQSVEIYINGRLCRDRKELERIASDAIKEIEVLTAPGAKYSTSTDAVIRIKTKKPVGDGLSIDYTNSSSITPKTDSWDTGNKLGLNYRRKGLDIGAEGFYFQNYYTMNDWRQIQRTQLQNLWQEETTRDSESRQQNLNATFYTNYLLNDSNSLGVRYNFSRTPKDQLEDVSTSKLLKDNILYEEGISIGDNMTQSSTHYANLYYNGKIKEWEIAFNADAMLSNEKQSTYGKETFTNDEREVPMRNKTKNSLYAGKLDLTHPLWGGKISFGAEYSHTDSKNTLIDNSGLLFDHQSQIKENNIASWVEYNRTFGKLSATAGLRYEHLSSNYYENGKKSDEQSRTYNDLFPSLSLSLPIGKVQTMLSYRPTISRPFYSQLSSAVIYDNRYLCTTGDPKLKATYSHALTFTANYKWATLAVNYNDVNDGTLSYVEQMSQENPAIGIMRSRQFDYEYLSADLSLAPTIGIWTPELNFNFTRYWFAMPNYKNYKFDNPMLGISLGNTLMLPRKFILYAAAYYNTEHDWMHLELGKRYDVYISINKSMFKDQLNLTLYSSGIFRSDENDTMLSGNREINIYTRDYAEIGIRVRYKFNTAESKYKGTGAGSSQKNRM